MSDTPTIRPPSWSATPRGRRELVVVALFCAANLFIPLAFGEMYPFSNAPMFYNAPQCYCEYKVQTPDGGVIEKEALTPLGLQRNYWGNPPDRGMGVQAPPTVDCFGEVACEKDVRERVVRYLREHPEIPYLDVTQQVIGPVDAFRVGPVDSFNWRVENPGR